MGALGFGVPSKVLLSLLWFLNDLPPLGAVDSKVLVGFCSVVVVPGGFASPMGPTGGYHLHSSRGYHSGDVSCLDPSFYMNGLALTQDY